MQLVAEVVAQRDEVDEVVGVEMGDRDGIEVLGPDLGEQARERSLTEIEEELRRASGRRGRPTRSRPAVVYAGPAPRTMSSITSAPRGAG
jgi:hypothetical protein